jgi:hypothetical protein
MVIDQVAETPQSGWRLEQTAHDALEIEFLVDVNEFVSGQRGDHKRRLAPNDRRQAIEEIYQPIEKVIARHCRTSLDRSRIRDCIVPHGYVISSDI